MFNQLKVNKDLESNGIGLAIVKKFVTKNKGIISLYSKKDTGLNIEFSWRF
jgi:light-regulated signal transduction histidine kinase (bacteriophytochrome)